MIVSEINTAEKKREICRNVLQALPDWFGIPQSTEDYIKNSAELQFYAAEENGDAIGFAALKQTSESAADIYVMGIYPQFHNKKIGRALVEECKAYCRNNGLRFLQVKTLDKSFPDEYYAKTREFYKAVGFVELECIPEIWGKNCPCMIMIMSI